MTDEEAINILEKRLEKPEVACALNIAIKALKVKKELIEQNKALWETNKIIREGILNKSPLEGEWINQEQGALYPIECSKCHNEPFCDDEGYVLSNFCPNCGADMREADNEIQFNFSGS